MENNYLSDADKELLRNDYLKMKHADLIEEVLKRDSKFIELTETIGDLESDVYQAEINAMIANNKLKYQGGKIITLEIKTRKVIDEDVCDGCDHDKVVDCKNIAFRTFSESVYAYNLYRIKPDCGLTYTTSEYMDEWVPADELLSLTVNGELVYEVID